MSKELHAEICILGAGPGGCSAAIRTSQLNHTAIMLEKGAFPRDKVCGDALSGKVMRTLERLDPGLAATVMKDSRSMPSWGVTFVAPNGRALRVPFARGTGVGQAPGSIMPRLAFDDLLFQRARKAPGITVVEQVAATTFERTSEGWCIRDRERTLTVHAQLLLDASGANSRFVRALGERLDPRHHAAGVRAYFHGVADLDPNGFIELLFLRELLPGYLWVFPMQNGMANVGLGLRSDVVQKRRVDLKALLLKLIEEHPQLRDRFRHASMEGSIQGMGLPLASERRPLSGNGYLLIGDAGHLIDPFTGEGISHAMISGVHAAEVAADLLDANDLSKERAAAYDARIWKRLGKELAISTRLQQMADKPWLFNFVVDRANQNPALADTISSMFTDMDLRERLKKPGFYMDLLLGRTPVGH